MAILRYLSSGAVKGVGPSTAARIVEKFGEDTLDVMEKEPARLAEVRGISPAKAQKIGEAFAAQFGLREVMLTFSQYGLTPNEAAALLEAVRLLDGGEDPGEPVFAVQQRAVHRF